MGIAIWHFAVFVPDRFWAGIVGAFLGAIAGSILVGAIAQVAADRSIGQTDLSTALIAVPGAIAGLAVIYVIGRLAGEEPETR
jgi:hypothetical protein